MAPVSLLLLLLLCWAGNPTTAAPPKQYPEDYEKPGECPVPATLCTAAKPAPSSGDCMTDKDCLGEDKCCVPFCTPKCTPPILKDKPGKCPVVNIFAPCSTPAPLSQCSNDQQCDDKKKCCDYVCNFQCANPYY